MRSSIIYEPEYRVLASLLAEKRRATGLSQRAIAVKMGRAQSHVQEMETGQKRIELIEFCRFLQVLGFDPLHVFAELTHRLSVVNEVKAEVE